MRKGAGMAPGTDPHADIAVGPHRAPVIKTGFRVEFPAQRTVDFFGLVHGDGIRRTAGCAFLADATEILHAEVHRFIRHQG